MPKIILILALISLIFTPIFVSRGPNCGSEATIWASEGPEMSNQGIDSPPQIKPGEVVATAKKVFKVMSWLENIIKKIWEALLKAYWWLKGKIHEPVNPEDIKL